MLLSCLVYFRAVQASPTKSGRARARWSERNRRNQVWLRPHPAVLSRWLVTPTPHPYNPSHRLGLTRAYLRPLAVPFSPSSASLRSRVQYGTSGGKSRVRRYGRGITGHTRIRSGVKHAEEKRSRLSSSRPPRPSSSRRRNSASACGLIRCSLRTLQSASQVFPTLQDSSERQLLPPFHLDASRARKGRLLVP
jgi:hypothetical protein